MNFKNIFFLMLINLKSSKFKSILYFLILTLFFLVTFIVSSAEFSVKKFDEKYVNSDFEYRLLAIAVENEENRQSIIEKINRLKIKHVGKIFESNMELLTTANVSESILNIDGIIDIYGVYDGIYYNVESGRKIQNDDEIICPSTFSPLSSNELSNNQFFNLKSKIGNSLNLSYSQTIIKNGKAEVYKEYNEKVKLVGTYNIKDQLINYHTCYVSTKLFEKIIKNSETIYENEMERKNPNIGLSILVLIDNYKNISDVQNQLLNNGIKSTPYYELENDLIVFMQQIVKYVTAITFAVSIICIYIFIKNNFSEKKQDIALYKLIGFNNKTVGYLILFQYAILTISSFIFSIILSVIIKYAVTYVFTFNPMFDVLSIYIYFKNSIYIFIGTLVLISIFVFLFFMKSKKHSILRLLNE